MLTPQPLVEIAVLAAMYLAGSGSWTLVLADASGAVYRLP